jgi:hypothetical protein
MVATGMIVVAGCVTGKFKRYIRKLNDILNILLNAPNYIASFKVKEKYLPSTNRPTWPCGYNNPPVHRVV